MHVRTLGRAELSANGTRLGPEAKVAFPLLLHLVLERDHWVSRVQLQEMLFPEQDRDHARHSLRQSVYTLRKEGFPIEGSGPALHIPAKGVVDDYSTLLTPQLEGERELAELMGGWLAGFEPTISKAYSHWFEGKRGEVALGMRSTLLTELAVHKRNARWGQCERTCRAILTLDPLNEEATLGLAESLALTGAKVQAIRILERYQEEMPNADLQLPANVLKRRISEHPSPEGKRTPILVGRESQLQIVQESLTDAQCGDPSAILVSGGVGFGKSRLLIETEKLAQLQGFRLLSVRCRQHDALRPLGVFINVVPRLRAMPGALGCDPEAHHLLSRLESLPDDAASVEASAGDSSQIAASVSWAITELVSSVLAEAPLVLTVDDAHWADDASLRLISEIVEGPRRGLVVLLGARQLPALLAGSDGKTIRHLPLSCLTQEQSAALFRAETSIEADNPAIGWAHAVSGGNPLYLVTLARHLREQPTSRTLPTQLTRLLDSRLSGLTRTESMVFAAIVALGRQASHALLDSALALPVHEMVAALDRLDANGFIAASGERLEVTHPLLGDAAIRMMAPSARQYLFHAAVQAMTTHADPSDPTVLWDMVELLKRSGNIREATRIGRQLARQALTLGRAPEACDLLIDLRESLHDPEARAGLEHDLILASRAAGRWSRVKALCESALLASVSPLPTAELRFASVEAEWHEDHKYEVLMPALLTFASSEDLSPSSRFRAAELLLIAAVNLNDADLGRAAISAARAGQVDEAADSQLTVSMIYEMSFGNMSQAATYAKALANTVGSRPLSMQSVREVSNAAAALGYAGRTEEAVEILQGLHKRADDFHFASGACRCATELANILLLAGRYEESRTWLAWAIEYEARAAGTFDWLLIAELNYWFAIFDSNLEAARGLAAKLLDASQGRSPRSVSISATAVALCEVRSGERLDPARTEGIVQSYLAHRGGLDAELWTWAVCEILRSAGDVTRACSLAREYVADARREGGPVRSKLAQYLSSPISGSP